METQLFVGPVAVVSINVRRAGVERYHLAVTWKHELEDGEGWHTDQYTDLDSGELIDVMVATMADLTSR